MKITKFSFENNYTGWKLAETDFHPLMNLLVGASGVGKTKILTAIKTVLSTALGSQRNTLFDTKWTLHFDLNKETHCEWSVQFSSQKGDRNGFEMPLILAESLSMNEEIIFERTQLSDQVTLFFIKERGVAKWISQYDISAGMFKTFIELGRIYLSPENSLILIDEFENSLGANCIDAVTESIIQSNRNNQFIITSHHPYIINNIPINNWKIISREGGLVRTHNADELGIGKSRLSAFLELQQSDLFLTGSESIQSLLIF